MILPLGMFAGIPVYLISRVVRKHLARRRGARNRVRSTRMWIGRTTASPVESNVIYQTPTAIYAGSQAYAEIERMGMDRQ